MDTDALASFYQIFEIFGYIIHYDNLINLF